MGADHTRDKINNLCSALEQEELIMDYNMHYSTKRDDGTRVCWRRMCDSTQGKKNRKNRQKVREYIDAFACQDYSFLLNDGAIVQISLTYKGSEVIKYRYVYLPCPISWTKKYERKNIKYDHDSLEDEFLEDENDSDFENEIDSDEQESRRAFLEKSIDRMDEVEFPKKLVMIAPLRFEWKKNSDSNFEPPSHVHLGLPEGKIAISHPVSLSNFLYFIFKNFYSNDFDKYKSQLETQDNIGKIKSAKNPCIEGHENNGIYFFVPNP